MATTRPFRSAPIALAALSFATAVALTRVLAGGSWLWAAAVCVALPHGVGALATRREWAGWRTALAHTGLAALVTLWFVVPSGTVVGIPTAGGIGDWLHALSRSVHVLRSAIVPVPPIGPALLLSLVALWAAAAASQWSAARLDGVLGAIVPQLALFIAIGALGRGHYLATTMLWAAAAIAFLLCAHLDRLMRARTWFQAGRAHQSRLAAGGAIAALVAVAGAGIIGPHLPGSGATALLDYRHLGSGRNNGPGTINAISPLVDMRSELNRTPVEELFVVRAATAARWRQVALDDFDGAQWTLSQVTGSSLPPDSEPIATQPLDQEYHLTTLGGAGGALFLPAAYRATAAPATVRGVRTVADSATLVLSGNDHTGLAYQVSSDVPAPTVAELDASPPVIPDNPTLERTLSLPAGFPAAVTQLAQRIVRDARASTPYAKAIALQSYLRAAPFTYDQTIPADTSSHALEHFLFTTHRGFCQQFAGAFGALARAVGLPTRLAVGFLPGTLQTDGYHVTTRDAHAWPEVYFNGIGWIDFEPTPQRFDTTSPGDPNGTGGFAPTTTTPTTIRGATTTTSPSSTPVTRRHEQGSGRSPGLTVAPPGSGIARPAIDLLAVLGGLAVVALVLFGGPGVARALRRFRRSRAPLARTRVLGAWAEAVEVLALHDIARSPARTPVEFAMRDAPALGAGAAGPALIVLARLSTAALYAPEDPSDEDAETAWIQLRTLRAALHAQPRRARWRRRVRRMPRPRLRTAG